MQPPGSVEYNGGVQEGRPLRFISLFSGIEAASVAWNPLGWEAKAFSEVDPFACSLLAERYPDVPNLGDVRKIDDERLRSLGEIDLLVAGFPCQDLSTAGQRKGLTNQDGSSTRSGLFYDAARTFRSVAQNNGCRWGIFENVPGLLTSEGGRDFAAVASELTGLPVRVPASGWQSAGVVANYEPDGWSLAWRVLDARFFDIPQRRKRVFITVRRGDWRRPAAVLFERGGEAWDRSQGDEGEQADSDASRGGVADGLTAYSICLGSHPLIGREIAQPITRRCGDPGVFALVFDEDEREASSFVEFGSVGVPPPTDQVRAATLPFVEDVIDVFAMSQNQCGDILTGDIMHSLTTNSNASGRNAPLIGIRTAKRTILRKAMPSEAERIQGFEAGYTAITHRGKPAADGPRCAAVGNSFPVPVVRWIGERIQDVEWTNSVAV